MRRCVAGLMVVGLAAAGCGLDTGGEGSGPRTTGHFTYASEALPDADRAQMDDVLQQRLVNIGIDDAEIEIGGTGVVIEVGDHGTTIDVAFAGIERQGVFELRPVLEVVDGPSPSEDLVPEHDASGAVVHSHRLGTQPHAAHALVAVAGTAVSPAGDWGVQLTLSDAGDAVLTELAGACFAQTEVCPTGRLAMVLDGVVLSAPTVQQPSFERDQVQISGGLDEASARELALILQSGALPVALRLETTTVEEPDAG